MKRLTYISSFARPLTHDEIVAIAEKSIENNRKDGLTGVLFCFKNIFYQILEGDDAKLDACYSRIKRDDRHKDQFCLNIEHDIEERFYSDWHMKTVILDESQEDLIRPLRNMLDAFTATHRIMSQYSPIPVLKSLQEGINPNTLPMQLEEKIILFSDLMASTTLYESLPSDTVKAILDKYYEIATKVIRDKGGVMSKFTGDGFMAYFEISQASLALAAVEEIMQFLEETRSNPEDNSALKYMYAGFGIATGNVLLGNVGSSIKKDYTLLGDAVNIAARLESLTRKVDYNFVCDESFIALINDSTKFKKLGAYVPKGKFNKVRVYTSANDKGNFRPLKANDLKESIKAKI